MTAAAVLTFSAPVASEAADGPKYAGIVVDAKTGNILYSENADSLRYPASLTKMMTLYLVFEALEAGKIRLDTKVPVSENAAKEPPSKLGLKVGGSFTVEQGILALVTRSANDASTALGEFIGGSESRFAQMMTNKARQLGMTRTTYRNANGLPNTAQMTTARDQARLGIALRQHFPQYYGYFSTRSFKYGKQVIGNHNRLLGAVRGVDGIKTGFTRAAGFNLVTSAQADGRSVVGVVLGGTSGGARDAQMRKLIGAYLPKASRRGKGTMIEEPGVAEVAESEIRPVVAMKPVTAATTTTASGDLPVNGPLPGARYEESAVETAFAAPTKKSAAIAAAEGTLDAQAEKLGAVAIPRPAPEYMPETETASATTIVDDVTTASTGGKPGWVIQIGVSPTKQMAMDLLQSAQVKGGKVLRSATPFAIAINNGGAQVYRARFGGFDNQKLAINACNQLKKKGMNCWASLQ
nr:D-alanyl-D-alanine carboxypeptidase [Rhizobium album]